MPYSKSQHAIDPVLTQHARYTQPVGFIADKVFPPMLREGVEDGQIEVWDSSNLAVPDDMERGVQMEASRGSDQEPSYKSYKTKVVSRKKLLTAREVKNYAGQTGIAEDRLRITRTNQVTNNIRLGREVNLATKLLNSSNYPTGYSTTIGAGDVWSSSGGDPLGVIKTAKSALRNGSGSADETGNVFANAIIMDQDGWEALEQHTDLLDFMKYTKGGIITSQDFITIFGLVPIVAKVRYKNSSGVITPVWSDAAIVCYIKGIDGVGSLDMNDPESDMTFGRTILSENYSVIRYNDQKRDHKWAQWIEAQMGYTHEFIGVNDATNYQSTAGYLIDNIV